MMFEIDKECYIAFRSAVVKDFFPHQVTHRVRYIGQTCHLYEAKLSGWSFALIAISSRLFNKRSRVALMRYLSTRARDS